VQNLSHLKPHSQFSTFVFEARIDFQSSFTACIQTKSSQKVRDLNDLEAFIKVQDIKSPFVPSLTRNVNLYVEAKTKRLH